MHSTHRAELDLSMIPSAARAAHIFPNLASGLHIPIGQLRDAGCTALFNKTKACIFCNGKIVLRERRRSSHV